jgi:hypothetical protein
MKKAERTKKNFLSFFFPFCYNSCWGSRILLKFCMSNLGVVFHIWCKRLDLFWSVRDLNSKMPTYPNCQLAPVFPMHEGAVESLVRYTTNNLIHRRRLCKPYTCALHMLYSFDYFFSSRKNRKYTSVVAFQKSRRPVKSAVQLAHTLISFRYYFIMKPYNSLFQ